ncbi:MAG: hypothetical protein KDC38_04100 [Planctomycetes bacterium]|nr:hypothetical protein [Planctomycetota bacterium]
MIGSDGMSGEERAAPPPRPAASRSDSGREERRRDIERFESAHRRITQRARQLGENQHRARRGFRLFDLRAEIVREMAQLRDVFERYPDVADAVGEILQIHHAIGIERRLDADRFAVEISRCLHGFAVRFHRLVSILIGRSRRELDLIGFAFEDRYGETIRTAFERGVLAPPKRLVHAILLRDIATERQRLSHLLAARRVDVFADTLYLGMRWRWGRDERAIFSVVQRIAQDEEREELLAAVRASYQRHHGGRLGAGGLDEAIAKNLKPIVSARIAALLRGDEALETVLALAHELERRRPRLPQLAETLRGKTRGQLKEIRNAWRRHRGTSVAEELGRRRWTGKLAPVRDYVVALTEGRRSTADAAFVRAAVLKHPGCWIGEPFVGKSVDAREALIDRYDHKYGTGKADAGFWPDLRRAVPDRTRRILMERFVRDGYLSEAELLRDCMHGFGTDERGIKEILARATADELREIEVEYRKFLRHDFAEGMRFRPLRFAARIGRATADWMTVRESGSWLECLRRRSLVPRDLWMDLEAELDGDDWLDAQLLRNGKPADPIDLYRRTASLYEHERGGKLSRVIDWVCHDGKAMDRDFARARAFYERYIDGRHPRYDELQRLQALVSYAGHAFESFRAAKHSLSFIFANLASGLLVAVVATIVLALRQPLPLVMLGCFLASGITRLGCRWVLAARGYGREKVAQDLALAAVDGVTFAAGTAFRQVFGSIGRRLLRSKITHKILKSTSSYVLKRLIRTSEELNERKRSLHLRHSVGLEAVLESEERDINELLERLSIYA